MKKIFYFIILFLANYSLYAQSPGDSTKHFYYSFSPIKTTVHLKNGSSQKGMLSEVSDSTITILSYPVSDSNSIETYIPIREIKTIRIKRNALALGATYGGGAGFLLGGLTALALTNGTTGTSNHNDTFTIGGIAGIFPGAGIGAGIGGIIIQGKFRIKGKKNRMYRLGKILIRRDKTLNPC